MDSFLIKVKAAFMICCHSYTVRFTGCCWISLVAGGSRWEIRVKGNLTRRTDNGLINTSPISTMSPVVRLQYGCNHTLQVPGNAELTTGTYSTDFRMKITFILVADADGDTIRCRWAESSRGECSGVCKALPGATLSGVCLN